MSSLSPNAHERRLLICATGAISVISLPVYLMALRRRGGIHTTVIMSYSATTFIPSDTVGYFADCVLTSADAALDHNHMTLAANADLIYVLPASAHTLALVAQGAASPLIPATILGSTRPATFFPSMNRIMWESGAVRRNIDLIKADGHTVHDPAYASGYEAAFREFSVNPTLPLPGELISILDGDLKKLDDR